MDTRILTVEEHSEGLSVTVAGGYSIVIDTAEMEVRAWFDGSTTPIGTIELENY